MGTCKLGREKALMVLEKCVLPKENNVVVVESVMGLPTHVACRACMEKLVPNTTHKCQNHEDSLADGLYGPSSSSEPADLLCPKCQGSGYMRSPGLLGWILGSLTKCD